MDDLYSSVETIRLWANEFKRERTSVENTSGSGGPKIVVIQKIIDRVLADR